MTRKFTPRNEPILSIASIFSTRTVITSALNQQRNDRLYHAHARLPREPLPAVYPLAAFALSVGKMRLIHAAWSLPAQAHETAIERLMADFSVKVTCASSGAIWLEQGRLRRSGSTSDEARHCCDHCLMCSRLLWQLAVYVDVLLFARSGRKRNFDILMVTIVPPASE